MESGSPSRSEAVADQPDRPTVAGATPAPAHHPFHDRAMPIRFWVPGDPVPWPRARLTRDGRFIQPHRIKVWKETIRRYALQARVDHGVQPGPLAMSLWFQLRHNRGDIDNYAKAILDALTGVLYRDDRQVQDLRIVLRHGGAGVSIHLARIE